MRAAFLLSLLATGCFFSTPAPPHRRDAANITLTDAPIAPTVNLAPVAVSPPPATPPVETDHPWDGCGQDDPNPWPWRDAGKWGEDPRSIPSWSYEQERRAPKMPDADRFLHSMGATKVRAVDDGLLICEVELYSHNGAEPAWYHYKLGRPPARPSCGSDWDTFAGPDALVRLRLRDDYPIALFGPEDHWGFFVSVPRMTLHAGDPIAVKLWDRDAGSLVTSPKPESKRNEYMGQGKLVFDGQLPFSIRADFFRMRCNLLPRAAAHSRAQPWIGRLERALKAAENWHPSPDRWGWGSNQHATSITSDYGNENFRYAAGFVGWDDEAIQSRIPRAEAIPAADDKKKDQLTAELIAKSPLPEGTHQLPGGRGAMKILATDPGAGGSTIEVEVGPRAAKDLCDSSLITNGIQMASIDDQSAFQIVHFQRRAGDDWVACAGAKWTSKNRLRGTIPIGSKLLWVGGVGKALIFRAPEPAKN